MTARKWALVLIQDPFIKQMWFVVFIQNFAPFRLGLNKSFTYVVWSWSEASVPIPELAWYNQTGNVTEDTYLAA